MLLPPWKLSQHPAAAAAKSLQSCPTLCNPTDGSPPGSPVPEILQARTLEWVAISFSNAWKGKVKVILSDPMDCSLPGSSIHGILQARVLEWVAIAFSVSTPYLSVITYFHLATMTITHDIWNLTILYCFESLSNFQYLSAHSLTHTSLSETRHTGVDHFLTLRHHIH